MGHRQFIENSVQSKIHVQYRNFVNKLWSSPHLIEKTEKELQFARIIT